MAASKDKAVLFGRVKVDRTVHQWPIAVFNDKPDAVMYVTMLKLAYKSGDDNIIKAMDPSAVRDAEGKAIPDTTWSVAVVPYAPKPELDTEPSPEPAT